MADPTARPGEQEGAARLIRLRRRHEHQSQEACNAKAVCGPAKRETSLAMSPFALLAGLRLIGERDQG
jgi:hypothetical protein